MYINHQTQSELTDAYSATRATDPLFREFCALPCARHFSSEENINLFSCFEISQHQSGEKIYQSGTPSDMTLRVILNGAIHISATVDEIDLDLGSGDAFGLFSFLDRERCHSATAVSQQETTLLCINRAYFDMISVENDELGNQLLRFMFQLLLHTSLKLGNEYQTSTIADSELNDT